MKSPMALYIPLLLEPTRVASPSWRAEPDLSSVSVRRGRAGAWRSWAEARVVPDRPASGTSTSTSPFPTAHRGSL
jgi:hypothetical protein